MSKFNINGLTDAQQQSCMSFMITNDERVATLGARGNRMTGYPIQTRPGMGGEVYYWPMGEQPSPEERASISDKNPVRAAEKFLGKYFAKIELKPFAQAGAPILRPAAQATEEAAKSKDNEVIEMSLCSFDEFLPEPGKAYRFVKAAGCPACTQVDLIMGLSRRAQG